jgi:hypothetical protein
MITMPSLVPLLLVVLGLLCLWILLLCVRSLRRHPPRRGPQPKKNVYTLGGRI